MIGRSGLLGFVAGSAVVQCFPAMPTLFAMGCLVLAAGLFTLASRRLLRSSPPSPVTFKHFLVPLWAAVFGLLITVARVEYRLSDELAPGNENRVSRVVLRVASLVRLGPDSRQFEAEVISSKPQGVPSRISVTWPAAARGGPYGRFDSQPAVFPDLVPGQLWRMSLTLKKPHAARNPDAFDYEGYLFARGLRATGNVRGTPRYLGSQPWASLPIAAERARHFVREAMQPYLKGKRYGAVLLALAIGDQASVDASDWQIFNRSGITHLVSISGSHITMIAALGGWLVLWLWRRMRFRGRALAERLPAQVASALAALMVAWLYCLLAGWGVPARRTFLMLLVLALAHVARLPLGVSRVLCLVVFAVVALDPWAVLASGFWLSFGAVYVLMASSGWWGRRLGRNQPTRRQRAGQFLSTASRLQLAITVGLMPLLALIFHQVSLASPLVNAYAIPIVSLVVTPLSLLLAAVAFVPGLEWLASCFAWVGHGALSLMMGPTIWLSELGMASFDAAAAPFGLTVIALLGLVLAVMPYGFPGRRAAWLLILPVLFWRPERPAVGYWSLFALDVGQSSAILLQTAHHVLLFDTGLRSGPESDEGARTIWPFMRARGMKKLDVLVVSHADIDHAGGARSLLSSTQVEQSYSSFDLQGYLRREASLLGIPGNLPTMPRAMSPCAAGTSWQVDGLAFEFLWPLRRYAASGAVKRGQRNDQACVLLIRGLHHSALLTSDIGALQEASLLDRGLGSVDVVMAPHHGSRNSSSLNFVQALQARDVVAQAGKWNRYGHPNPQIQQRWEQAGARFWRTDRHGAFTVQSRAAGLIAASERQSHRRYWEGR